MTTGLAEEYRRRLAQESDVQGHLEFMHETVCRYPQAQVIELGVRQGNSTAALLAGVEQVGGFLWSCDIDAPVVPREWFALKYWRLRVGDDISDWVLATMPAECDVLFIDTSHDYGHTLAELSAYGPRVRQGGTILLHDTEWAHPAIRLDRPVSPVAQALDYYCSAAGLAWENRPGDYGMGVIRL